MKRDRILPRSYAGTCHPEKCARFKIKNLKFALSKIEKKGLHFSAEDNSRIVLDGLHGKPMSNHPEAGSSNSPKHRSMA